MANHLHYGSYHALGYSNLLKVDYEAYYHNLY